METNEGELIARGDGGGGELLSPLGYFLSAFSLFLIWIIGTTGNFLVFLLVFKNKKLQTPINMLLVNVAVFDFIMAFLGSPFPLIAAYQRKWPFGRRICTAYGFLMAYGGIGSITTLMVLAFERCLLISRPFRRWEWRLDMGHVAGILGGIWTYAALLTVPPLFGWAAYDFEGPKISCSINWESNDKVTKSYIIFLFVMGLLVPLLVITLSSFAIIRTLKRASGQQSQVVSRAEVHVMILIGVMIGAFCLAWIPYALVSLLVTAGVRVSPSLAIIPALIAKSSTCYNPIIYVGLNTQFRGAWRQLLGIPDPNRRYSRDVGGETTMTAAGPGTRNLRDLSPGPSDSALNSPASPRNPNVSLAMTPFLPRPSSPPGNGGNEPN